MVFEGHPSCFMMGLTVTSIHANPTAKIHLAEADHDPESERSFQTHQFSGDSWIVVFMGYNPQESLENTTNAMGTLLGVHQIVP